MSYPQDIFSRMYGGSSKVDEGVVYPKKDEEISVQQVDDALSTNIFNVMLGRRSQRKFENREIEPSKIEMILAAADTAPTAGGFQGFEIYHVKRDDIKLKLVDAANKQPYVNAPVVLVFCMNPGRIKMNFPENILKKFSLQDATLAAGLCAARCACFGTEFHLDWHDRRTADYENPKYKICALFYTLLRISTENTST